MSSAYHGEGFRARKIGRTRNFRNGFLTGVDQVRVFRPRDRILAQSQHAVLRLKYHFDSGRHMIGDQSRHADSQINVETVSQLANDALNNPLPLVGVRADRGAGLSHEVLSHLVAPTFAARSVRRSIRFSYLAPWMMRCT